MGSDEAEGSSGSWTPVQDATSSFHCRTPGCEGEAKSQVGRHAYCPACQVKRGTRRIDPGPEVDLDDLRERLTKRGEGENRFRPDRERPGVTTTPKRPPSRRTAAERGPLESSAIELVAAARRIDGIIAKQAQLKRELPEAMAAYQRALQGLPNQKPAGESNGAESPGVASSA